ncbi:hypothetical protein [Paenibacillus xylanilyticus]|uniref:Lipoprotein n=1 Tax=Paenibacillus xylanilyticus TaxID=248903 RepID=A0A7Y6BTX8_9BACL|nr:hypothetical protein [Paenibacillus xylanilyticus]NUU74953.1 hypothetical protein [Paenibacillus xylanilyticus]
MKKLSRGFLSVVISGVLLLSACEKSSDTYVPDSSEESISDTSQTPSPSNTPVSQIPTSSTSPTESEILINPKGLELKEISAANFEKGIFIDFDRYKKSFFNDDIISKFKSNIEAVVENNKEKFGKYLYEGSRKESIFFSEEDVQYMFYDLDLLEKIKIDGREQIRVGIQYAKKYADERIENTAITYFFTKNKEGKWRIENID